MNSPLTKKTFLRMLIGSATISALLGIFALLALIFIVTGFTLGHSVTLSLNVLGLVSPDLMLVEALIETSPPFSSQACWSTWGISTPQ